MPEGIDELRAMRQQNCGIKDVDIALHTNLCQGAENFHKLS